MKRKLNEDDVPVPIVEEKTASTPSKPSFESLNLDPRLLQAVVKEGFSKPTEVQSRAIPLVLDGKDVLGQDDYVT